MYPTCLINIVYCFSLCGDGVCFFYSIHFVTFTAASTFELGKEISLKIKGAHVNIRFIEDESVKLKE